MKRHLKLHLIELFAMVLLISIYSLIFIPLLYYTERITLIHILGFTTIAIFINFCYGTFRVWWKHRGHYMPEEEVPHIYEYLEKLSEEFGTRKPRLVVFDTDVPNAYATDTLPTRPIIAITRGLMEQLDTEELKSVIAHEMSHIRSYDVFFMLFLSSFINIIERLHYITTQYMYTGKFAEQIAFIIPFIITWTNLQIVYMILFFVSRIREVVADKDSADATSPQSMKGALQNITTTMEDIPETEQKKFYGESALTIIPLDKFASNLFSTHPSTDKRIKNLEKLEDSPLPDTKKSTTDQTENKQDDTSSQDETEKETTQQEHTTEKNKDTEPKDDEEINYPTDLSLRGEQE